MPFYTFNYGFDIEMTMEQAESVSGSGDAHEAIIYLMEDPDIAKQLAEIDPEDLKKELAEWSDWDVEDHEENLERILWIAGTNITDGLA